MLIAQVLVSGLAAGAVYGLIGLGYSLIFRMSRVLNFAQGDMVTLAIFSFLFFLGGGGQPALGAISPPAMVAAATLTLLFVAGVAVLVRRVAVAPFGRSTSPLGWIAATAAAGLVLRSVVGLGFQAESYTVPDLLPLAAIGRAGIIDLPGGGVLQAHDIAVLIIGLGLAFGFDRWLSLSRTGRAVRASADDEVAASLVGISPARLQTLAWLVAGLLTAVAGLLIAPSRPVTLELGVVLGLKGVAAAVLGGIGHARGAVAAGLALGVLESVVTNLGHATGMRDVLALALLILGLALVPQRIGAAPELID